MRRLSNNSISKWLTCPKKYLLSKTWKVKPEWKSPEAYIGGGFHEGIANYMLTHSEEQSVLKAFEEIPEGIEQREEVIEGVFACLNAVWDYDRRIPQDMVATEIKFEVPLSLGVLMTGYIDGLVESEGLWVKEYKTTGTWSSDIFFEKYTFDRQALTYVWAAEKVLEKPIKGVCVEAVFKGKKWEVERRYFEYSKFYRDSWLTDTYMHAANILTAHEMNRFPKTENCIKAKNFKCEFWDYCSTEDNVNVLGSTHVLREKKHESK